MFKELEIRLQDVEKLLQDAMNGKHVDLEYLQKEVAALKEIIEGLSES